jgi:hypothetical protein
MIRDSEPRHLKESQARHMGRRLRAGWALVMVLVALLMAACGPDLALLDSPQDLYITGIALTGAGSGWAVGLQPAHQRAVLLRESKGAWQLAPDQPPTQQGDALKAIAVTGATLWVAGARTDAAHGDATQESGFVSARGTDGVWHRQQFGAPINGLAFTSGQEGWAVGDGGALYHFLNGTWTQYPNNTALDLYAVAARAPDDVWAVGALGMFIHYNGTGWQQPAHFTHVNFYGLALSSDDGWAVGDDGTVVRLAGNGLWYEMTSPMNVTGRAVAIANSTVWILGDHGLAFTYATDTQQWQHLPPPADAQFNVVAVAPDGSVWAGGNLSQASIFAFTGGGWRAAPVALGS